MKSRPLLTAGILALSAVLAIGVTMPPIPVVKAVSPKAKATAAVAGSPMVVVGPKLTNYATMTFKMPNNGAAGYWSRPVTVQWTLDFKKWSNVLTLPAGSTNFAVACTNKYGFYRLMTPSWK